MVELALVSLDLVRGSVEVNVLVLLRVYDGVDVDVAEEPKLSRLLRTGGSGGTTAESRVRVVVVEVDDRSPPRVRSDVMGAVVSPPPVRVRVYVAGAVEVEGCGDVAPYLEDLVSPNLEAMAPTPLDP